MNHAIITVPSAWTKNMPVGFSEAAYQNWHEKIEPGCRILLFMTEPVNAIVAEGVIPDNVFQETSTWPNETAQSVKTGKGQEADYVLPLRILFAYDVPDKITQEQISEYEELQAVASHEILPVDVKVYRLLRDTPT